MKLLRTTKKTIEELIEQKGTEVSVIKLIGVNDIKDSYVNANSNEKDITLGDWAIDPDVKDESGAKHVLLVLFTDTNSYVPGVLEYAIRSFEYWRNDISETEWNHTVVIRGKNITDKDVLIDVAYRVAASDNELSAVIIAEEDLDACKNPDILHIFKKGKKRK